MAKTHKLRSIRHLSLLMAIIPAIILSLALIGTVIFSILYIKQEKDLFLYILIGYDVVLFIAYALSYYFLIRLVDQVYSDGLYRVTASVLKDLSNNVKNEEVYPNEYKIREFDELNKNLKGIRTTFDNSTLISLPLNLANIPFEYINQDLRYITLKSFKDNLRQLIYCAQNFRNAIVEVFYDIEDDRLENEEFLYVVKVLKKTFADFDDILFAPNENNDGVYAFIPHLNSFSRTKEYLLGAMRELGINKKTYDGLATIGPRFSFVCYPYSNIDELIPDLRYARRQGQLINFYFPSRLSVLSDSEILQNSVNLNNMSRILNALSFLNKVSSDKEHSMELLKSTLTMVISFLGIKTAGIFVYDDYDYKFRTLMEASEKGNELFKEGQEVDKGFINTMNDVVDLDGSYYFSTRRDANYSLAKYLDRINVYSGFYYILKEKEQVKAIIYFFNKEKNLQIDSYIRESLYILSYRIADFFLISAKEDTFADTFKEINNVLKATESAVYRIDPDDFTLVGFSEHLTILYPNAKYGEKCYKALYGLDAPCKECPLKTAKKMLTTIDGNNYEVSLALNDTKTRLKRLFVRNIHDAEMTTDRFDKDLLINSYPSLVLMMNNLYSVNARGYVLLLRVDNHEEILKDAGSEGLLYLMRQFISSVKTTSKIKSNIYYYNPQTIAILLPEVGHVDLVNFCEKVYELTKMNYPLNGVNYQFNVTYLPYAFPQQYPTADAFLKYTLRHYTNLAIETGKDQIYFPDGDYTRPASKTKFMLSVIEDQFVNKTFTVALQPMVRAHDKSIFGAEILIRLSDNYRNMVFNADELIRVAGQNGKISLISNTLLDYIGGLYQQFGLTTFKVFGFTRLTINTDYSFFTDPNFVKRIYDLQNTYHLPKEFLGFEITEKEVFDHLGQFKAVSKSMSNLHVALICDQYSGEFVSMDKLKDLGFDEVKIGRKLVSDIEVNGKHLNEVKSINEEAKNNSLKITFVGVENSDQYLLLRDMNKNCACQGYHFYRPLDDVHLVEELRKNQ
ncbi:MAG: EAL domain-containing protein [Bacilli bacterium]|nr:EAL domain-containing protein [Bacilli bacterium]